MRTLFAPLAACLLLAPAARASVINTFDAPGDVITSNTAGPGVWFTDRYAPAAFTAGQAGGGRTGTLLHSISAADANGLRPGGFNSTFYNTQGRQFTLSPNTNGLFIDLYVPASWNALSQNVSGAEGRLASLWGVALDGSSAIAGYPIIEFNNNRDGMGGDGFRTFDPINGVWVNATGFTGYDQWYRIGFTLDNGLYTYFVNGQSGNTFLDTDPNPANRFGAVILQGYNAGNSYDINWDNLGTNAAVPEPISLVVFGGLVLAGGLVARRRMKKVA
jgi:hypothetical protein